MAATLTQAAAGDEVAFARIVNAFHGDMVRVAYGVCGEREAALDAVQAAWVIAWRKLHTIREPEHLRSWLVAVAANEARHVARHRRTVTELSVDVPDQKSDPGDKIARYDLANALHHLTSDERTLLALRYGAGLDSNEIAPLLNVSPSGVRVRLMRTLERLRKELRDE